MTLEYTELSPRELAVRLTDKKSYFVSEATVYRLLKAHYLITSPAYVVINADDAVEQDVVDLLHLLQDYQVELDVRVDRARRLHVLYHLMETLQHHARRGRNRHT